MSPRRTALDARVGVLADLANAHFGAMSDLQKVRGMHQALAIFRRPRRAPARLRLVTAVASVAAAALFALLIAGALAWWTASPKPLAYIAADATVGSSGYFRSVRGRPCVVRFSDGTPLVLRQGARGRIASVDANGARVMLDDGGLHVSAARRDGARWTFDAGPFSVHAGASELWLSWDASQGQLDLQSHRGPVTVTGPLSEGDIVLRPGQWLTVRMAEREVLLREVDRFAVPPFARAGLPEDE